MSQETDVRGNLTWETFHSVLPAAGTFSKDPRAWGIRDDESIGMIRHGYGPIVMDISGRSYIDWVSGLGANLFGHNHRNWMSRWMYYLHATGLMTCASLPHMYEYTLAIRIADYAWPHIKGAEKWEDVQVRFGKTGSDVLDMAVRLARAAKSKDVVLFTGYHGWHDWTISATPPAWGIPRGSGPFAQKVSLNDLSRWPEGSPAAVVVEIPLSFDPKKFDEIRQYCNATGALLILDEVVTGFRYGVPGYVERLPVKPDIICFGKALGNGLPISAIVGPKDLMSWFARTDPVFCSSTAFGDVVSLSGGLATLDLVAASADGILGHIRDVGTALIRSLSEVSEPYDFFRIEGDPERSLCVFERDEQRALFIRWMMEAGIMMNRPNFPTVSHTKADVEITARAAAHVLERISKLGESELKELGSRYHARVLFQDR